MAHQRGKPGFLLGFCALTLVGCTGQAPIPELPGSRSPETGIVFRERLDARGLQSLFRSLNRTHRLDPLAPFLDTPAPETLAPIGELISKHFYESVFSSVDFVGLVDRRASAGDFSRWLKKTDLNSADHRQMAHSLAWLLSDPRFPELVVRDSALLAPELGMAWDKAAAGAAAFRLKYPDTVAVVSRADWTGDARKFFSDPKNEAASLKLAQALGDTEMGTAIFRALRAMRSRPGAFEGFCAGISRMLTQTAAPEQSQAERLLKFFETANGPTEGLFSVAETTLRKDPQRIRELTNQMQGLVPAAVRGFTREGLAELEAKLDWVAPLVTRKPGDLPSVAWVRVFTAVREAVVNLTGRAADDDESDALLRNLPIFLNTYALTRWLEAAAPVLALKTGPAMSRQVTLPAVSLSLADTDSQGQFTLNADVKKDLEALGLGAFATALADTIQKDGFGNYVYEFSANQGAFSALLGKAVDETHQVRAFADAAATLRSIAFGLTREEGGFGFRLSDLESENLMDDANQLLSGLTYQTWSKVKRIAFDDMKLGNLNADTRALLLNLYDGHPKAAAKLETLLDTVAVIYELDRADRDLPSAFEAYHRLLNFLSSEDVKAVGAVFRFLSETGLLAGAAKTPAYPGVVQFLKERSGLASLFTGLAAVPDRERAPVLSAFASLLGASDRGTYGTEAHFGYLRDWFARQPGGARLALESAYDKGWRILPSLTEFPVAERRWAKDLVDSGDFQTLWDFIRAHGEPGSLKALTARLSELSAQGYLAEAIDLLGHFQNDRLKKLSENLAKWQRTGELGAMLVLLDGLVAAP